MVWMLILQQPLLNSWLLLFYNKSQILKKPKIYNNKHSIVAARRMIYTFEILKSTSAGYADIPAQSVEVVHKEINWNDLETYIFKNGCYRM